MSLQILKPGLLSTLQDGGRWGFQKEGILVSGPMDMQAFRLANLLVGNPATATALEISLIGPRIRFEENHLIAITGADLSPEIDGTPIHNWRPVWVRKGATLSFHQPRFGRFAYLAVAGSYALEPVMGSTATYLRAALGGYKGRALQSGDLLPCPGDPEKMELFLQQQRKASENTTVVEAKWSPAPEMIPHYMLSPFLRIMKGPEWALLSDRSRQAFWKEPFTVSRQSDRMGYGLEGPHLELKKGVEILSSAVTFGSVQLPAGGQTIVLMADRQTTGGYPRIAQIAAVDLPLLVQLQPGSSLRFTEISLQEAQQLYIAQEERLIRFKRMLDLKANSTL